MRKKNICTSILYFYKYLYYIRTASSKIQFLITMITDSTPVPRYERSCEVSWRHRISHFHFPLFFFLKLSLQTTLFCRCLNVLATCLSSGGGISLSVSQKPEGLVWPKAHSSCLVTVSTNQPLPSTCRAGVSAVIGLDVTCCILQTVRVTLRQKGHGSAVATVSLPRNFG